MWLDVRHAGRAAAAATGRCPRLCPASSPNPFVAHPDSLCAQGELDVIADLVSFVEQQQFLSVAGIHRHPPSLEERVRARALRLAAAKRALRRASERLTGGAAALRAHQEIDARFLAGLASLRRRWRLRRHSGEGAWGELPGGLLID